MKESVLLDKELTRTFSCTKKFFRYPVCTSCFPTFRDQSPDSRSVGPQAKPATCCRTQHTVHF